MTERNPTVTAAERPADYYSMVRERQRKTITGIPESTWRRLEKNGLVPARRSVGDGSGHYGGWLKGELLDWLASLPKKEAGHAA